MAKKVTVNDSLGNMIRAHPFSKFDIKTADGDTVRVHHPDFAIRSPVGDTAVVYDPDGHWRIINLDQVVQLEPVKSKSSKPGKR